jgi:glycine/D-amino acid oxidase-like deaminating enzyme
MNRQISRRNVVASGSALIGLGALGGCVGPGGDAPRLPPVRASADRISRITVCTRPFRADGPRLDVEQVGTKTVVHNYGHGGSGWSLSWGSSTIATRKALATGSTDIAVIGCGALGLTSATLLQRAGASVTIYAKDRPPDVRSSLATGVWTPDSRICLAGHDTPAFRQLWEEMCRTSFARYQTYLGLPGEPVEWIDSYILRDAASAGGDNPANTVQFAELQDQLVPDLRPRTVDLSPETGPFPGRHARRSTNMMFNLTAYGRLLMSDFLEAGGHIETMEFRTPADFAALPQKVLVNCTGYGARALFKDDTIVPVRGQLARLIPQPEVNYGLVYRGVSMVPRRDGLVVQVVGGDEGDGYNDDTTVPDRAGAEAAVATIASLFASPPSA